MASAASATRRGPSRREPKPGPRRFKQARSAETYRRLLDAAAELFAEVGYDAAQTPDIARRAGVSTGAFYRYFEDKRHAFVEVIAQHTEEITAEVSAELVPERFARKGARSLADAIELVLDALFARLEREAELQRVFLSMSFRDPAINELRSRLESAAVDILEARIAQIIPRDVVANPRAAAVIVYAAALAIASARAGVTPRDRKVSDRAMRDALREMLQRYLFP